MKKILTIFFIGIILTACCKPPVDKDSFEFSGSEEEFLRPFKISDTIYFENDEFDTDTILIREINRESYNNCSHFLQRPPVNWVAVEIEHLPVDKWTGTSQNAGETPRVTYQYLFSMRKDFERNSVGFSVSFRGFHSRDINVGINETQTLVLSGKTFQNCYKLEHNYPERINNSEDIVHIYWIKEDGMVAYENKDGKIWIKKNL